MGTSLPSPDSHPAIITFAQSHNQGEEEEELGGREHGRSQVHEMCEYVREMNWNGCESASVCRRMRIHACVCVCACEFANGYFSMRVQRTCDTPFFSVCARVRVCAQIVHLCAQACMCVFQLLSEWHHPALSPAAPEDQWSCTSFKWK